LLGKSGHGGGAEVSGAAVAIKEWLDQLSAAVGGDITGCGEELG